MNSHLVEESNLLSVFRPAPTNSSLQVPGAVNETSDSDEELLGASVSREAVKEQYVFMGSLYTLTRLKSDGSYVPRVDVSPAHRGMRDAEGLIWQDDYKKMEETALSDVWKTEDSSVTVKANGAVPKMSESLDSSTAISFATVVSVPDDRTPLRPASLALRTVFPNVEGDT